MKKYIITKIRIMFETIKILKSRIGSYIESTKVFVYISAKISWIINKKDNFYLFINNPQHYPKLIIILILVLLALYYNDHSKDHLCDVKAIINNHYWNLVIPIMYLIFKEKIDLNTKKDCLLTIIFILFILIISYIKDNNTVILCLIFMYIFFMKILYDSFIGQYFAKIFAKYVYFIRTLVFFYLINYHPIYSQIFFGVIPGTYVVKLSSIPYATLAVATIALAFAYTVDVREKQLTARHINGVAQEAANAKAAYASTKAAEATIGSVGGIPPIFP